MTDDVLQEQNDSFNSPRLLANLMSKQIETKVFQRTLKVSDERVKKFHIFVSSEFNNLKFDKAAIIRIYKKK